MEGQRGEKEEEGGWVGEGGGEGKKGYMCAQCQHQYATAGQLNCWHERTAELKVCLTKFDL